MSLIAPCIDLIDELICPINSLTSRSSFLNSLCKSASCFGGGKSQELVSLGWRLLISVLSSGGGKSQVLLSLGWRSLISILSSGGGKSQELVSLGWRPLIPVLCTFWLGEVYTSGVLSGTSLNVLTSPGSLSRSMHSYSNVALSVSLSTMYTVSVGAMTVLASAEVCVAGSVG